MKNKVSIIIPVYRTASTIERCVKALCEGIYQNIEVLLIEDCSPDDSWTVCLAMQEKYPQVKTFKNEKNLGVSATRNRGLQEMTGDYLMFVDSDDWTEPDFVESFIVENQKRQADLTVSGYLFHDEINNTVIEYLSSVDSEESALKGSLIQLDKDVLLQQIWNKLFLAEVIKKNKIAFDPTIKHGEDFRFVLSYLKCCEGDVLALIQRPLYHYIRFNLFSAMANLGTEGIEEHFKNMRALYGIIGLSAEEINQRMEADRAGHLQSYAYMIMHNVGMPMARKKRLILALDDQQGRELYKKNKKLYRKERIASFLKRLGLYH